MTDDIIKLHDYFETMHYNPLLVTPEESEEVRKILERLKKFFYEHKIQKCCTTAVHNCISEDHKKALIRETESLLFHSLIPYIQTHVSEEPQPSSFFDRYCRITSQLYVALPNNKKYEL